MAHHRVAPLRHKLTGKALPMYVGHEIAGWPFHATPVAGATNLAPSAVVRCWEMTPSMRLSDFHRVLVAETVSNFGSMLSRLVIPGLATLVLSATPFEMGLLLMADVVAGACGALLLGATVDRLSKRAVMLIFATGGLGALLGTALAPPLGHRFHSGGAILFGLSCLALGAFCIPLAPGAMLLGAALLIVHQVLGDSGHIVYEVHDRTLRQTAVAPHLLARVDAGIRTLGHLATLLGALGGGALATVVGARLALTLSATLFMSAAIMAYRLCRTPAPDVDCRCP